MAPAPSGFKQGLSSSAANVHHLASTRLDKEAAGSVSGARDRSTRREKAPPAAPPAAVAAEGTGIEAIDSNASELSAAVPAIATADAADADSGFEVATSSSLQEAGAAVGASEAQECLKQEEKEEIKEEEKQEEDESAALVTWQARDAAALARQSHPCPLPQALFAPDIVLPPQQAAALAGGAAPLKRQQTKPFLAFMEGLGALQCVSQSGVVSLDIERIFPLGPCNDSLR